LPPDDFPALPVPFVPASPEDFEADDLPPEDFADVPPPFDDELDFDEEPPLFDEPPELLAFDAALPPVLALEEPPDDFPLLTEPPALLFPPLLALDEAPPFAEELAPLPADLPALPVPFVPASPPARLAPPLVDALELFDLPALPPLLVDEPPPFDEELLLLPPFLPPPVPDDFPALPVPFVPASPPSSRPLAASAKMFIPVAAAPCAALDKSSPATSLTVSRMPPDELFLPPLFDFLPVDSLLPFFAAIFPPLNVCKT
jgi:hypothetical protein